MENEQKVILHIEIKNKEEVRVACEKIRKIKNEVTLKDLADLPIQWDIKLLNDNSNLF